MTEVDNKSTPSPVPTLHAIPPLGGGARDSDSVAPARPQGSKISVGPDKV